MNASVSCSDTTPAWLPRPVAFNAELACANRTASCGLMPFSNPAAKPALNTSPQPQVQRDGQHRHGPERSHGAQRLPALYPQVLQVLRRSRGDAWPGEAAAELAAAEAEPLTLDEQANLREMRRAWMTGFGNARLAGRDAIDVTDLPDAHARRAPIGFVQ